VDGFVLPPGLSCPAYHPPGADPAWDAWLAGLPRTVARLAGRWSLRLGEPFLPGGSCSWVAPARTAAGEPAVLKVGWAHDEAEHEADGLRAWDGRGAVRLLGEHRDGPARALLLEACRPGVPLSRALPGPEQDAVLAGLLRRLWITPPPGGPFRPLGEMCAGWVRSFLKDYGNARALGRDQVDPGVARAGMALFRELPAAAPDSVLLATDLHHDNVLASEREPWLAIDPKPYAGDPAYDVLQHMLNFPERLAADPGGFAARMAGLTGLDAGRVRLWLFARCVQESVEDPNLQAVAARLAP
jgi:streptomycin 6-kinase